MPVGARASSRASLALRSLSGSGRRSLLSSSSRSNAYSIASVARCRRCNAPNTAIPTASETTASPSSVNEPGAELRGGRGDGVISVGPVVAPAVNRRTALPSCRTIVSSEPAELERASGKLGAKEDLAIGINGIQKYHSHIEKKALFSSNAITYDRERPENKRASCGSTLEDIHARFEVPRRSRAHRSDVAADPRRARARRIQVSATGSTPTATGTIGLRSKLATWKIPRAFDSSGDFRCAPMPSRWSRTGFAPTTAIPMSCTMRLRHGACAGAARGREFAG